MGINDCGLTVGTTNIKTFGSRPGIGYLASLHRMLRARNSRRPPPDRAQRSGAHVFWMADPFELREYETSPPIYSSARPATPRCVTPIIASPRQHGYSGRRGHGEQSLSTGDEEQTLTRGGQTVETIKRLLRPKPGCFSINRYAEDDQELPRTLSLSRCRGGARPTRAVGQPIGARVSAWLLSPLIKAPRVQRHRSIQYHPKCAKPLGARCALRGSRRRYLPQRRPGLRLRAPTRSHRRFEHSESRAFRTVAPAITGRDKRKL